MELSDETKDWISLMMIDFDNKTRDGNKFVMVNSSVIENMEKNGLSVPDNFVVVDKIHNAK